MYKLHVIMNDYHQSEDGDHHHRELEEHKLSLLREASYLLEHKRGGGSVLVVTEWTSNKMVVILRTQLLEKREPLIWDTIEGWSQLR